MNDGTPATKRRRTTPPDGADRTERASSALRQPPRRASLGPRRERDQRSSSPLKQPPRRPSIASSYASPTKASLARGYPNLLGKSPSRPSSRGDIIARGHAARAFVFGQDEQAQDQQDPDSTQLGAEEDAIEPTPDTTKARDTTPRPPISRRSGRPSVLGDVEEEGAELPDTPSGVQDDTPRRGALFSSPVKRPPRIKGTTKLPSFNKAIRVLESQSTPGTSEVAPEELDYTSREEQERDVHGDQKRPVDPELERKKQEKAKLMRELQGLEDQVIMLATHVQHEAARDTSKVVAQGDQDRLITAITKVYKSSSTEEEKQLPSVSNLLCSFLPFSRPVPLPPRLQEATERPIPSHKPVKLADADRLAYLGMFTSFQFTSRVSLPEPVAKKSNPRVSEVLQTHTVDFNGHLKLLTGTIEYTVDVVSEKLAELHIVKLPSWAEAELGKFIRKKAQEMDISTVTWAISSYWNLAKKRAEYWHAVEEAFSHLIPGRSTVDRENPGKNGNGKGGKHVTRGHDEDEELSMINDKATMGKKKRLSRLQYRQHLGRETLSLQDKHVILKLKWRISFDWTGEAESQVLVEPVLPRVWSEGTNGQHLNKIPVTFDALMRERGAFEATRVMVSLLFPSN